MAQIGLIYIGSFAQADTNEGNWSAESPDSFFGLHDKSTLSHVTSTVTTPLGDGIAYDDDNGQTASQITYDLGAGSVTSTQDSVETYNATIKLGDGTTVNTQVNVIQLTNGAAFINESVNGIVLDNLSIQSIIINSRSVNNASGWRTVRSVDNARIVCFLRDTLIATPEGQRPVQSLCVGDLVLTQDHGPQPVVWRAATQHRATARTAPISIAAGALGPRKPHKMLCVSPQHRILLELPILSAHCDAKQVLVAAKKLVGLPGISQVETAETVEYHHIMCTRHEVVFANDAACESFFPGPMARKALDKADLQRLNRYFLKARTRPGQIVPCRPMLTGKPLKSLLASGAFQGDRAAIYV